jgi:hypothetical protein
MTERQVAVYTVIIDLIYDHGGETPDDPKHIASYFADMGTASARNAIQQLVDMGKVYRVGDMLHQKRAENEAKIRENLSEIRAKVGRLGGISSGNTRRAINENNGLTKANASSKHEAEKEKEEIRVEVGKPTSWRFDAFWTPWPNKVSKAAAEVAWKKVPEDERQAAIECIAPWFDAWRAQNPQASPIHAATYLNKRRWRDQFQAFEVNNADRNSRQLPQGGKRADAAIEQIARLAGLGATSGDGRGGVGGFGEEAGPLWMGARPQ